MALYRGVNNTQIDEEEKKRQQQMNQKKPQTMETPAASAGQSESVDLLERGRKYRDTYIGSGGHRLDTEEVEIDFSKYKPENIAELTFQIKGTERKAAVDYALEYYKRQGYEVPTAADIESQWDAWDTESQNRRAQEAIEQKESALGITGMNKMSALSTIAGMADGDEKTAAQNAYADLTTTQGSQYYTAYAKATSAPLATLGVESVDDAWFEQTKGLEQYLLRDANTGKIEKPGNSATEQQKQAYARHLLLENEQTTKTAEAEMASLYDAIAAEAQYTGFDPKTFIDEIDWTEYPTLKKMMDGAYTGEYVQLNRAVPMSTEAMYGMAYCAMNGITPTDAREYEMYAGAYVNDLKKQATLGTDEEEPEGFLEGVWDAVSGEKKDRQQRIAQGEAARAQLEALGVNYTAESEKPVLPDWVGKRENTSASTEDGQEVYQPEELLEPGTFIKPRTLEDDIKQFQAGGYTFVESAQDRNTLRRIDEQIELIKTEQEAVKEQRVANGKSATDEKLTEIDVQLGKLNAKKIRIAFGGSGETIANTNVTMKRKVAPGRTAGLEITPESADELSDRYEQNIQQKAQQEEPESQNMQPPVGHGTTAWQMWYSASTDETEAMYADYERKMAEARAMEDADARLDALLEAEDVFTEGIYAMQVRAKVLEGLIPTDEATAALHEAAGTERISMLCEREVASALGEDDRVEEINNALIEAGYPVCWPEEEEVIAQERAQSIEYAKGWGDDAVRERLGITDGRELTDEDYYQAAHTDKGFLDWSMWGAISEENKENAQASLKALGAAAKREPQQLDAETTEGVLQGYAEAAVGKDASIEQAEAVKDAAAVPLAITGGAIRGVTGSIEGAAAMAEAFAFEAARAQYGHNLTREQMEILSPGYKMVADAKAELDKGIQTVTPDVSQRSDWVQTIGSLSETVIQNAAMAQAGSLVGKTNLTFAKMMGIKKAETLAKVYRTSSNLTRNMGFTLSGFKSGMAEAQTLGLDNEEAIRYAVLTAGISMAVEEINIDPLTDAARVLNKIKDGKSAAKKGVRILAQMGKSALGEAVEEAVESPAQNFKRWLLADRDMAWFGEGGVIDPGEMLRSAAMGGAAGAILGAAGAQVETRTQKSEAQGNVRNAADTGANAADTGANAADTGATIERAEQIQRKAQDYVEIMQVISDPDANEDVMAMGELAAEEVLQKGEMSDETRAMLQATIGIRRLKAKIVMEDVANLAKVIGSEYTSAQTKDMAEKALENIGSDGMDAKTRKAVADSAARDIAKAQAWEPAKAASKELGKAQKDEKDIKAEYGQMNGRLKALNDNAADILQRGLSGTMTKELQGEYSTALNKINSMTKRVENQKARMRDAQERTAQAKAAYDAAAAQAKLDEERLYQEMMSTSAKAQTEQQTQAAEQKTPETTPQNAEEQIDRATIAEIENGNEAGALEMQKAKEATKAAAKKAVKIVREEAAGQLAEEVRGPEVWDRYEDYDVKGLRKYLRSTTIYVDEQQKGDILYKTGEKNLSAVNRRYGMKLTANRSKASESLDGQAWADVAMYLDENLASPQEAHPEERLIDILDDIKRNEQEMKDTRNIFHSMRTRKKRAGIGGKQGGANQEIKTEQAIGEDLQRAFPGITVRGGSAFGNLQIESGSTDVESGSIRIVGHRNIADMAHEIGHRLSLRSGVNTAEYTAGGRVRAGSVKVAPQYEMAVDAMVDKIAQDEPDFFKAAEYATQEAKRQEAIAEFYNRYMEGGEDAAKILAGGELFDVLDGAMSKKERKALRQAHEDLSVLDAHRTVIGERNNVISKAEARRRELAEAASELVDDVMQSMWDIYRPLMQMDNTAVESILSRLTPEQRKKFIKLNKERGGTNALVLGDEQLEKYLETGVLEQQDEETLYNIASNLAKSGGIVQVWEKNKIVSRDGRILLDTNIGKAVAPLEESELAEFGIYHQLLQELDARNLREEHMKAFYAAKAEAPEKLKEANAEYSSAAKEVKRAQEAVERYSKKTDAGAKKALEAARERLTEAIKRRQETLAARMAAEETVKKTQGEYQPQTNDSYRSDWGAWSKADVEEKIAEMEKRFTHFEGVHAELRKIYNVLMEEFMIKPGYIENAQTAWENVTRARPHYLPTKYEEVKQVQEQEVTGGINKAQRTVKSAKAGDRDIVNPVSSLIEDLQRMVDVEGKMRLKNQMAYYYDTYANMGEYMREITMAPEDIEMERSLAAGQTIKQAESIGAEMLDILASAGTKKSEGRVVVAIQDGQARYFEIVDQQIYNALEHGKLREIAKEEHIIAKTIKTINNTFRTLTTGHIGFGFGNVAKDALTGAVMTQDVSMKGRLKDYAQAMAEVQRYMATGKIKSDTLLQFAAMGGLEGDAYSHDVEGERKRQRELMQMRNEADTVKEKIVNTLVKFNDITEAGRRYSEFQRGMRMGMTNERAFRMSQESTTDFSRTGLKTREFTKYVYFGNAILQDSYSLIHAFEMEKVEPGRAQKMMTRAAVRSLGVSLAYEVIRNLFWNDEDKERYDNLEENYKRENFILWMTDGRMIMVPKGQSVLFTALDLPRDIVAGIAKEARNGGDVFSYIRHEFGTDIAEWVGAMVDDMNPFGSSLINTGMVALGISNKNYFGDDVEPQWMIDEGYGRQNITDEKTSVIANALSYVVPLSPKKIHYIIDQQLGWVGDVLLNVTTPSKGYTSLEEADGFIDYVSDLGRNALSQLCNYMIKSYVRPSELVSDLQGDFYDYKDFISGAVNQYKAYEDADNKAWRNKNTMSMLLSDAERENAYEDAVDMEKYLTATQKAIKAKKEQIAKYPEESDRITNEIVQLLVTANHYAESWQRRYMDGDLTVQVKIPKGEW